MEQQEPEEFTRRKEELHRVIEKIKTRHKTETKNNCEQATLHGKETDHRCSKPLQLAEMFD